MKCSLDISNFLEVISAAKSLQSCPTLCEPTDGLLPGSSVSGILQARTGVGCHLLLQCMKGKSESEVPQSRLTPSDPMDCSLPGSPVHGILQAGTLDWVAISFSNVNFSNSSLVAKSCLTLATPQTVPRQVPLSMGLSRQEYWSGLPFPSPDFEHR